MATLRIIEIYSSIQGETSWTGLPTTFIRLAACNLRCNWCDTPYSFVRGEAYTLDALFQQVENLKAPYVCITGGEPLLQQEVYPLIDQLLDANYKVNIETGGSLPTDQIDPRAKTVLDIKCPGSGMAEKNHWANLEKLRPHDEVKFVLADRQDYLWACQICRDYSLFHQKYELLFSPVHGILDPKDLIDWILEDQLPVRVNLQIHKYIWTPETKGV